MSYEEIQNYKEYMLHKLDYASEEMSKNDKLSLFCELLEYNWHNRLLLSLPCFSSLKRVLIKNIKSIIEEEDDILNLNFYEKETLLRFKNVSIQILRFFNKLYKVDFSIFNLLDKSE